MPRPVFLAVLLLPCFNAPAQTPAGADLQKQRTTIHKKIEKVKESLKETRQEKNSFLRQLGQVQDKLQAHEQQLGLINRNINRIDGDIYRNDRAISLLEKQQDTLRQEYARSIVYSYKSQNSDDLLSFLFTAASFNEMLHRMVYLRVYRAYREQQVNGFYHSQDMLRQKIAGLDAARDKREQALKEENRQQAMLAKEKQEKAAIVGSLKIKESNLLKELAEKKKQDALLADAITAAVRNSRKVIIKKNTKLLPAAKPYHTEEEPAIRALTGSFENNRGRLPWPVAGHVSMHFGRQPYSDKLFVENPGITIETTSGATVKAVFDGQVLDITFIGSVQAVILSHGGYITAYSNLSSVNVIKGQEIKQGQAIGKVADKDNGKGDIEFIISNNASHNFDPERWLR